MREKGKEMADRLRRVAGAYHERASDDEKVEANKFFNSLDANKDGVISLEEFQRGYDSRPSAEEFFKKLDSNGDGVLDFGDVLVLFYHHKNAISISRCDGCNQKLFGPYFSCVVCLDHSPNTYDLCCDCHRGGRLKHHHPLRLMLHDQAALVKFIHTKSQLAKELIEQNMEQSSQSRSEQSTPPPTARTQSEIEELRKIAKAHYEASPPDIQESAEKFFESMDSNKDGQVSLPEFTSFMSGKGYKLTGTPRFFNKLDEDGDGKLDFWEVITLNYIIKSGRPFCDCCGEFIPATFFSCVHCFKASGSFDLCRRCFQHHAYTHSHNGRPAQFLDNYSLLQIKPDSSAAQIDSALEALKLVVGISATGCVVM